MKKKTQLKRIVCQHCHKGVGYIRVNPRVHWSLKLIFWGVVSALVLQLVTQVASDYILRLSFCHA